MKRAILPVLAAASLWAQAPRGWDTYQAIMWSTGSPRDFSQWSQRLREMGFTAEQCGAGNDAAPWVRAGLGFYVENMASELWFLNARKAVYDADYKGYTASRDKSWLVRKPCLNDPEVIDGTTARVQNFVRQYAGQQPLLYQLRDELSIGSLASPMDYCFGPHTLAAFRSWLRETYGSLESLNAEWNTGYESWEDVMPLTTYEAKDRERAALAAGEPENYAPWADHRAFMDLTFSRTLDTLRGGVRTLDSITPVGVEGLQMPSAWGGFDLWRMSQAVDWVEPYDIAGSREVFRSFMPADSVILSTTFGSDFNAIRGRLWRLLLHGDRGTIVWDDDTDRAVRKNEDGMPLTDRGRGLAEVIAELKEAAPRIFPLRRTPDPIAIHYSQASIRAHWMFDSREDKDTWPRRFSSYEAVWSRFARVRDSFMRAIEDQGLQYNFVSYEQIENGELANYKVLILPESVAMSANECRAVEGFVRAGGTVIADNMTATMDEHGRRLPQGQLDALFGIERKSVGWRAKPAGGAVGTAGENVAALEAFEPDITVVSGEARKSATGVPAVVVNSVGDGRAVYLNLAMQDYGKYRLTPPRGDAFRELFAKLFSDAGVTPAVRVVDPVDGSPVPCVEVWRYEGPDGRYAAVMRNPELNYAALKAAGYPDNSRIEQPVRIRVIAEREYEADLDPWRPVILKLESPE